MKALVITLLFLLSFSAGAQGDAYRVDLIVFLDKFAPSEAGRRFELPNLGKLLTLDDAAGLTAAGISLLPEDQFGLTDQWQRLRSSKRYQPLTRLSWLQQRNAQEGRLPLRLIWGDTLVVDGGADGMASGLAKPVEGSVALLVGTYLNLDVNLSYTQPTEVGVRSWRLREKRRMKLDTLHYLDSPRLGVIARVSRAPR